MEITLDGNSSKVLLIIPVAKISIYGELIQKEWDILKSYPRKN